MSGPGPRSDFPVDRWERIKELYSQTKDLEKAERDWLFQREGTDSETREEILRLLGYREQAEEYFSRVSEEIEALVRIEPLLECGKTLGTRFEITRFLARGGMGEVYEAEDLELGGRLALKVMRPGILDSAASLQRFREEIRLARKINSPNVCRVYDVARHTDGSRDLVFFTMELLDGETLADRLTRLGPFSLSEAGDVIGQMALGLAAAHRAGILHRDFKSNNVMLCPSGDQIRVAITDFGLSRQIGAEPYDGLIQGATPAYVAPEQLERQEETQRTDIYSFGIVLFEMMTGVLPFRGASPLETAELRLTQQPRAPRQLRADMPRSWEAAILRCLERDPARRFGDTMEVAQALGIAGGAPRRSRRAVIWLGAAAAATVPVALVLRRFNGAGAGVSGPTLGVLDFEVPSNSGLEYLAGGLANRISDELTDVPGLRVLTPPTVQRISGKARNLVELERSAHVTHLVSGRLDQSGGDYLVSIQLAAAASGAQIWAKTREVTRRELEGVSRIVVREIIQALHIDMLPAQISQMERPLTKDGFAYEQYLLGRYYVTRRDRDALSQSVACLEKAVAADPEFAAAHAALGLALAHLCAIDGIYRPEMVSKSNREAALGLKLDPTLAEAHVVLARNAHFWDWDWKGAEGHYRSAVQMKPLLATGHYGYAALLDHLGRSREALAEIDRAYQLDPFDPSVQIERGNILLHMNRADDAIAQQRSALSANAGHGNGWVQLSSSYAQKGLLPDAIEAARRAAELPPAGQSFALAQLGYTCALAGRYQEAAEIRDKLESRFQTGQASAGEVAAIYCGWHDRDRALEWLERGVPLRDVELTALKVDSQFSFLRGDPRYRSLLAEVHLE